MSRYDWKNCEFSVLVGKTLASIEGWTEHSEELVFVTTEGERYHMWHQSDCCESVTLVDLDGEARNICGGPITSAHSETFDASKVSRGDSETWTFYKIACGWQNATLRWVGESNGYYSESVSFALEVPEAAK